MPHSSVLEKSSVYVGVIGVSVNAIAAGELSWYRDRSIRNTLSVRWSLQPMPIELHVLRVWRCVELLRWEKKLRVHVVQ